MGGNCDITIRNLSVTQCLISFVVGILFIFVFDAGAENPQIISEELDTTATIPSNQPGLIIGTPLTADSISVKPVDLLNQSQATPTRTPGLATDTVPPSTETSDSLKSPEIASDEMVIEIDPKQSRNAHKSLALALGLSALIPGTGEIYLADKKPAKVFLLAEIGFWSALYVSFLAQDNYLQSARNYASDYAGIDAQAKDEEFLNTMGNYRSYLEKQHRQDSYEISQILSGKRNQDYEIPKNSENYWDFGSSINPQNTANWQTFQSSMRYYRASKIAVSFAIGALALNRILSIANTLHLFKHTSAKGMTLQMIPEIGQDFTGGRLSLGF